MISVSSFGNAAAAMADLLLFMKFLRTLQFFLYVRAALDFVVSQIFFDVGWNDSNGDC